MSNILRLSNFETSDVSNRNIFRVLSRWKHQSQEIMHLSHIMLACNYVCGEGNNQSIYCSSMTKGYTSNSWNWKLARGHHHYYAIWWIYWQTAGKWCKLKILDQLSWAYAPGVDNRGIVVIWVFQFSLILFRENLSPTFTWTVIMRFFTADVIEIEIDFSFWFWRQI